MRPGIPMGNNGKTVSDASSTTAQIVFGMRQIFISHNRLGLNGQGRAAFPWKSFASHKLKFSYCFYIFNS